MSPHRDVRCLPLEPCDSVHVIRAPQARIIDTRSRNICRNSEGTDLVTSSMLTQPFLTDLDTRAAIKGSRDPLGVQSIWSRFGRQVVGNLTTVSNSVRDFAVLMLGYYFLERVADEGGTEDDIATFLKWEQFAAYARAHVNEEMGFRGNDRVWARIRNESHVRIGGSSACQILGNQKTYGLWGLYSVPAKASGLLDGDPPRLTPPARQIVEQVYLPVLAELGLRDGRAIVDRLRSTEYVIDLRERSKDAPVLTAVGRILARLRARERDIYREHLLYGGPNDASPTRGTGGLQRIFADLLSETFQGRDWRVSPASIRDLARRARRHASMGESLAARLEKIRTCEMLIAPAVALFEYALQCDGQSPVKIAEGVKQRWGHAQRQTIDLNATESLERELCTSTSDVESGARWVRLAHAFRDGRYEEALQLVLEQNEMVMKARSGAAPWAVVRDDKLCVRFRDEQSSDLPGVGELAEYWRHAYFIESLRQVALTLRG